MIYYIHEDNMEKLQKRAVTIRNKCEKHNAVFKFEIIGEEFRQIKDSIGRESTHRFVGIDVEGFAKYNGWEFVATIEHIKQEDGSYKNILRTTQWCVIPDEFYTAPPKCDHCNSNRPRKDTYLIYNSTSVEFKQVGRSCLQEYTGGLNIEWVASMLQFIDELDKASDEPILLHGSRKYFKVREVLGYAIDVIRKHGYVSRYDEIGKRSTADRVFACLKDDFSDMDSGYSGITVQATHLTECVIASVNAQIDTDNYLKSLQAMLNQEYCESRDLGYVCSAYRWYQGHVRRIEAEHALEVAKLKDKRSEYVGEIKGKVDIPTSDFKDIATIENQYGITTLYQFHDEQGNVFVWFASRAIPHPEEVISVRGTVKDHREYEGVKQTVLTRCVVTSKPKVEDHPQDGTFDMSVLDLLNEEVK